MNCTHLFEAHQKFSMHADDFCRPLAHTAYWQQGIARTDGLASALSMRPSYPFITQRSMCSYLLVPHCHAAAEFVRFIHQCVAVLPLCLVCCTGTRTTYAGSRTSGIHSTITVIYVEIHCHSSGPTTKASRAEPTMGTDGEVLPLHCWPYGILLDSLFHFILRLCGQ